MGDIGAPLEASAWVSQKKRRTSCWDGWNMRGLSAKLENLKFKT
jgi:hypothetical protein